MRRGISRDQAGDMLFGKLCGFFAKDWAALVIHTQSLICTFAFPAQAQNRTQVMPEEVCPLGMRQCEGIAFGVPRRTAA